MFDACRHLDYPNPQSHKLPMNLLFIFTDEQRADTLAPWGNDKIQAPNLNRLCREGVTFRRAYVTQAICTPSRSSIMTGLYPHTNGCVRNNVPLRVDTPTLVELADFSDYATAYHGKWHLGDEVFPQHGFDEWIGTEEFYRPWYRNGRDMNTASSYHRWLCSMGYDPPHTNPDGFRLFPRGWTAALPEEHCKPAFQAEAASRFIRENRERPFALYVNFLEPHMPFTGPRDGQYDPDTVDLPENFEMLPGDGQPLKARIHRYQRHFAGQVGTNEPTERQWRELIARYWGLVSQVDAAVGRILGTLHDCGLDDETIVVFTSDHGDMMGSHGMVTKAFQFEEAVRVPLTLRIPGCPRNGETIEAPVSQVDLVPTLLELLGKDAPEELEGYSWAPMLMEGGQLAERDVFIEWTPAHEPTDGTVEDQIDRAARFVDLDRLGSRDAIAASLNDPVRTVITPDGFKLNYSTVGESELYDLNADPLETTNLVDRPEHRERIETMADKVRRWQERTGDGVALPAL